MKSTMSFCAPCATQVKPARDGHCPFCAAPLVVGAQAAAAVAEVEASRVVDVDVAIRTPVKIAMALLCIPLALRVVSAVSTGSIGAVASAFALFVCMALLGGGHRYGRRGCMVAAAAATISSFVFIGTTAAGSSTDNTPVAIAIVTACASIAAIALLNVSSADISAELGAEVSAEVRTDLSA